MAIYRSDQAQVSFGVESTPGAFPENATITGAVEIGDSNAALTTDGAVLAGATTVILNAAALDTDIVSAGDEEWFLIIGDDAALKGPKEIRKVMTGTGTDTLTLDHPLSFDHATASDVLGYVIAAGTNPPVIASGSAPKYLGMLPAVYEAVDVPDPEQAFEPYYILGGQNRNFYVTYPGQETLSGSIGGMVLLDATPLRFALGKITSLPSSILTTTGTNTWRLAAAAPKGATRIIIENTHANPVTLAAGAFLAFGVSAAVTEHSGVSSNNHEIRQVLSGAITDPSTDADHEVLLNAPLQFAHAVETPIRVCNTGVSNQFYHTIWEQNELDSITMNVNVMDSSETAANTWQRRYVGGKIGSMTLSAEEGGLVNVGWDSMQFLDMMHNMQRHSDLSNSGPNAKAFMPRYGAMLDIGPNEIGRPTTGNNYTRPDTSPYYFSQGTVKMFGSDIATAEGLRTGGDVIARLRSFSLSVSNSEEPRYYISKQVEGKRGPSEILEQRREYSMSATIAMPDSGDITATDRNIFKELLLAGDYRGTSGMRGFTIELTFTRGTNDSISIIIPGESLNGNANASSNSNLTAGDASSEGGRQGAFIRAAAHNINDANPIEAEVDILFRSMIINIVDNQPVYP